MKPKGARLDIRTTEAAKNTLENAAHYFGTTLSAFILECAMEKAVQILKQAQTIRLNNEEKNVFLAALDNSPRPNKKLKTLVKKHSQK